MNDEAEGDWIYVAGSWHNLAEQRPLARKGPAPSEDADVTVVKDSGTVDAADWQ